jgi:ubiquinone/menaquinone biosynthesis C-methylase UbiE
MAIRLIERNDGKILEVHANGRLTHSDYRRFVPQFERLVDRLGKIRILFEMEEFKGWKAAALWDDLRFDWKYYSSIEKLAIVGDKRWQKWMSGVCRPFTTAEIRYFDRTEISGAQTWINAVSGSSDAAGTPILRVFQSRDQTKAYYNKISRFYDLLSDRSEAPMRKAGLDLLQARPGEQILEIGFGTGHTLADLVKSVGPQGKVFGVDLSDRMVQLARENLAKSGLLSCVRLRCGDATRLPFSANTMDAIFTSFALELFDTPEIPVVLGECRRVLRPEGRIVVVGMSKEGHPDPLLSVFEWTHRHFPKFVDCRPIYVRKALEDAGFKIRKALRKRMWIPVEIVLAQMTGDTIDSVKGYRIAGE